MKSGIKRVICLACAMLMLVFAMTACGGDSDKDKDVASGASGAGTESATSKNNEIVVAPSIEYGEQWENFDPYASMSESLKGSTVRYATWIDHTQTACAVPLANMEADIGIKPVLFTVPQGGYVSTLMAKIQAGDIPDVWVNNEGDGNFPMTIQIAAPINKVSTVNLDEPIWNKSLNEYFTIDGNTYLVNTVGTPHTGGNMTFYNKRLFEENGFKTPKQYYDEGKWTWDNALKCAKDIKALGADYRGLGIEQDIFIDSLDTSVIKYDPKTATFSSGLGDKAMLEGYQWYADAKEQGLLDGSVGAFTQGKCGICFRGPYGLSNTGYFMTMDPEDVGFTYMPVFEEGDTPTMSAICRMYGIVEKAPNADGAGYFIRYWLDNDNYDLQNTYITAEAGNFYYELTSVGIEGRHLNFDVAAATVAGEEMSKIYSTIRGASSAGVQTALDSVSNVTNNIVDKCNALMTEKRNSAKQLYN